MKQKHICGTKKIEDAVKKSCCQQIFFSFQKSFKKLQKWQKLFTNWKNETSQERFLMNLVLFWPPLHHTSKFWLSMKHSNTTPCKRPEQRGWFSASLVKLGPAASYRNSNLDRLLRQQNSQNLLKTPQLTKNVKL